MLHGFDEALDVMRINNEKINVRPEVNRFFSSLEKFDPIKDPAPAPEENVQTPTFDYSNTELIVEW